MKPGYVPRMKPGRHYLYTEVNEREYATLRRLAARDGISVANVIRRCVNAALHEEGLDDELFSERVSSGHGSRSRSDPVLGLGLTRRRTD